MTRVRRTRHGGAVTGSGTCPRPGSVCGDADRTLTIIDVATWQTPNTRAKDSDRADTCQVLDGALAEGQLSMEEHRQRVSAATNATTLGELQSLLTDLQTGNPMQPFVTPARRLRGHRTVAAAVVGVLVVCIVAVGWLVLRNGGSTSSATTSRSASAAADTHVLAVEPSTTSEAPVAVVEDPPPVVLDRHRDLHSAEGLAGVIDEIRKRFGDTTGYELAVMADEAILARRDPTDERSKLIYSYEGGWGDPSTRSRSDTDDLTDLGEFDVQAAAAALQAAPETLRIARPDVSDTYLDIDHIAEPDGPGALELLVKVTTTSGTNGFIYLDGAGNIKRVEYPG
jgi:hypothetical protein